MLSTQPFKDISIKSNNWACEAGTVADPSKIDYFRPNLLGYEPVFDGHFVNTHDGYKYAIVHQYDRVPKWKAFVQERYNQEDESKYFTYRS